MKSIVVFIVCFHFFSAQSQSVHIDIHGGAAHYTGDLQNKRIDLSQSQATAGLGLSYDISNKLIIRGAANYIKLSGRDEPGNAAKRVLFRNLSFKSTVWEAQLALEYNLLDIEARGFTPYVFAGVAAFHFNPYAFDASGKKVFLRSLNTEGQGLTQYPDRKQYSNNQFAIPFGGGIKLALTDKLQVGVELGFRKLFTDYLDDVSGTYADSTILANARGQQTIAFAYRGLEINNAALYPAAGTIRGNPKNKDWYFITGIRISYLLGANRNGSGNKSGTGCSVNVF